jgi:hypothetical protein
LGKSSVVLSVTAAANVVIIVIVSIIDTLLQNGEFGRQLSNRRGGIANRRFVRADDRSQRVRNSFQNAIQDTEEVSQPLLILELLSKGNLFPRG